MSPSNARKLWLASLAAILVGVLAAADAEAGTPTADGDAQPPAAARSL